MSLQIIFAVKTFRNASLDLTRNKFKTIIDLSSLQVATSYFLKLLMVCRNLCERLYSKIVFGRSQYRDGNRYCRRLASSWDLQEKKYGYHLEEDFQFLS